MTLKIPKVSVIIPNYNHASYLQRRLDSVLNQSYQEFEVILLDDCSTDNSAEILNSYKNHPKVSHVVINSENSGSPFKQWAKGFELAKGEFIWIAESDDWCEHSLIETVIEPMEEDDSLVIGFCQSLVADKEGSIVYKTEFPFLKKTISGRDFIVKYMFGDPILINAGMAVFRKEYLAKIDLTYSSMKSAGDWLFWNSLALQGNVFISGKYLNYFTRHHATVSSRAETTGLDMKEGCEIFKWVKQKTLPNRKEIDLALTKRINIYFQQEKKYLTNKIKIEALQNLYEIDSNVKRLIIKRKIKHLLKRIL